MLDVFARRVVGWSIDATPTAALVANALGIAIERPRPASSTVIQTDQGAQYGSWAFTRQAQQVEPLDRQTRHIRSGLATQLVEYLEIFHNRQRRHSALGMLTPIEFETLYKATGSTIVA